MRRPRIGRPPGGREVRGESFRYIVDPSDTVDDVLANAIAAGGAVVKEAGGPQWSGSF